MPRSIWSGAISFGLVNVPVKLYSAVSRKTVRFHQLNSDTGHRIAQKRVDSVTEEEVPYDKIVKGFELTKERYVVVTPEELDSIAPEKTRAIDIEDFVDVGEVDPIYFERTSYLGPAEGAEQPYALLVRAMEESGLVGIVTYVMRDKQQLGCVRVRDGMIVLEKMFFADEIRPTKGIRPRKATVPKQELAMALDLIDRFRGPFEPEKYEDTYREALLEVIDRKRRGEDVHAEAEPERGEEPADLLEALRESVEAHGRRGRASRRRNGSLGDLSRDELERRARKAGIRGRSKMSKRQLATALERA